MSQRKLHAVPTSDRAAIAANELGVLFEALRDFAHDLDPDDGPFKRYFLLMLADRGDALIDPDFYTRAESSSSFARGSK